MKFVYGKQDWKTKERGQENAYLLTNGLGGFSSCTVIGSNTRNDHALLMAAVKAPNFRCNMIHRLEEVLVKTEEAGEKRRVHLSSQDYEDESRNEEGFKHLDAVTFEDFPKWRFHVDGTEVVKEIAMKQGENLAAVRYRIKNRSKKEVKLEVTPHLQFTAKGQLLKKEQKFALEGNEIHSEGLTVYFDTNGETVPFEGKFCEGLFYAYDACDGRYSHGNTYINHKIVKTVPAGKTEELEILYSMKKEMLSVKDIFQEAVQYRKKLVDTAKLNAPLAQVLVKAADQFISHRESTGEKTILAGYPFFEDWGRDTMIALGGCCISTGQMDTAKSILKTFAVYCRKGLMPNLFPEGGNEPMYNTVDAALLFIHALYLYYEKCQDKEFVKEMWPVLESIMKNYQEGTDFNIHMDEDGLICAGSGLDQVTWMDVRVNDILPTPRHGKPVEINAYWYNALCVMDMLGKELGYPGRYEELAEKVKKNFTEKFWNEEKECLRDVISGTPSDEQVRCNQIWAVSMPFTMLDEEKERKVVDTVYEKLYTPYGLRSLESGDPEFVPEYGGEQLKRDLSYHQGTVWTFPLGAYYLAYLKVNGESEEACETVKEQLEVMESALREGCIGQLPEIYDGLIPNSSRGCFAQAWSVGEILRVFDKLKELENRKRMQEDR